mgnify:CR=1 FL=1
MDGRALPRASAFSFQLSLLSCCVSFVRPEMQPFFEEYSSNICERHVSECATDFSVQLKLAQISGIALKIHASGEASTNCMKHGVQFSRFQASPEASADIRNLYIEVQISGFT